MKTSDIVRIFKAKRYKKGQYRAVCPVHGGRRSGPLSINEHADGSTGLYCFGQCDVRDVLATAGLTLRDLFADSGFKPSPEMRRVWADEERLKLCERQNGMAEWLAVLEPENQKHWRRVSQNYFEEWYWLRCKLYSSWKRAREREYEVHRIIREYGFDELWDCLPIARLQARIAHQRKGITP